MSLPTLAQGDVVTVMTAGVFAQFYATETRNSGGSDRGHWNLSHAEERLSGSPSARDRSDAMTALKRAVASRIRHIVSAHGLREAPGCEKSNGDFAILQALRLMKPIMSKELYAHRADIEHNDADPPEAAQCIRYSEFVFYFLRATDYVAENATTEIEFVSDTRSAGTLFVRRDAPAGWVFSISGEFSESDFQALDSANADSMEIRLDKAPTLRGDRLWLDGTVLGPIGAVTELVRAFMLVSPR